MKNRIYTIVLLTLCFCLNITMTQGAGHSKDNLHFSHISINNGLSQNIRYVNLDIKRVITRLRLL